MARGLKTGGRQKGTSNKLTGTTKEMISQIVTKELQKLPGLIDQLDPKDKIEFTIKLLPFILPKANPQEVNKTLSNEERYESFIKHVMMVYNGKKE